MGRTIIAEGKTLAAARLLGREGAFSPAIIGRGPWSAMGLGIVLDNGRNEEILSLYAPQDARRPVQLWRAMKILENLHAIGRETLKDCCLAARGDDRAVTRLAGRELAALTRTHARAVGGDILHPDPETAIRERREMLPAAAEFAAMLDAIVLDRSHCAVQEIDEYVRAGKLPDLPQLHILRERAEIQARRNEHIYANFT